MVFGGRLSPNGAYFPFLLLKCHRDFEVAHKEKVTLKKKKEKYKLWTPVLEQTSDSFLL